MLSAHRDEWLEMLIDQVVAHSKSLSLMGIEDGCQVSNSLRETEPIIRMPSFFSSASSTLRSITSTSGRVMNNSSSAAIVSAKV